MLWLHWIYSDFKNRNSHYTGLVIIHLLCEQKALICIINISNNVNSYTVYAGKVFGGKKGYREFLQIQILVTVPKDIQLSLPTHSGYISYWVFFLVFIHKLLFLGPRFIPQD